MLRKLADNTNSRSIASQFRRRRFSFFRDLVLNLKKGATILDVGGTQGFWEMMGINLRDHFSITLLNLQSIAASKSNFKCVIGDARKMGFRDAGFDVVFSNSVIEHVGALEDQKRMADEIRRVGKRYFLQTPNRFFPLEPHFLFPFFQFLPVPIRTWLLRNFRLGWFARTADGQRAKQIVESIRLLDKKEVLALFPSAHLYEEKLLTMTKSFVVYDGWERID